MDKNHTIILFIKPRDETPNTDNMKYGISNISSSNNVNGSHFFWEVTDDPSSLGNDLETHERALRVLGDILLGIVLGLLCLLTTVGNALVLHAVRTERALQSVSNMYIVSLAVADLTVGLIVMPISAVYIFTDTWLFGVAVCQFWIGVDYIASTASILNLFILSLDRYWSVTSPLRYLRKRTKRRAFLMITTVWFISSLWLLPIVGWHHLEHDGQRTVPSHVCDTEYATNTILKIITGILNYYLPLAIMYGLYTKIFIEIKRRSKMEVGQKNHGGSCRIVTKEMPSTSASGEAKHDEDSGPSMEYNMIQNHLAIPLTHIANGIHRLSQSSSKRQTPEVTSPSSPPSTKPLLEITKPETSGTDDESNSVLTQLSPSPVKVLPLVKYPSAMSIDSGDDLKEYYEFDKRAIDQNRGDTNKICRCKDMPSVLVSNKSKLNPPKYALDSEHTSSCSSTIGDYYDPDVNPFEGFFENNYVHISNEDHCKLHSTQVQLNIPSNCNDSETLHMFPKENHPAKNHVILKAKRRPLSLHHPHPDNDIEPPKTSIVNPSRPHSINYDSEIQTEPKPLEKSQYAHHLSVKASSPTNSLMRRLRKTIRHRQQRINSSLQKEIKAAKQLGVIMSAFTVCFLPYFVCFMVVAFCESCVPTELTMAVTWVGYINSTLNPFLYPLCNDRFKRKFRKMLRIGPQEKRRSYYTGALHRTGTFRGKTRETLHCKISSPSKE